MVPRNLCTQCNKEIKPTVPLCSDQYKYLAVKFSMQKKTLNGTEETSDLPLTGVGAEPVRFWELDPPDKVRDSPDTVRLQSLNPLRDKSPPPKGLWDSVRGLKCLQRQDLMFKRIWLRSIGVGDDDDRGDEEVGRWEELFGSEVLVSEVLVLELRSGELGSGEASGSGSGSESRL